MEDMECGEFGRQKNQNVEFKVDRILNLENFESGESRLCKKIGIWMMHIPNSAYSIFWAFQIVQIPFAQLQILGILFFGHSKVSTFQIVQIPFNAILNYSIFLFSTF